MWRRVRYGARSNACGPAACLLLNTATSHAAALSVGGFSTARGGSLALAGGAGLNALRTSITAAYPGSTFAGADTLTPAFLSSIHVLIISSAREGNGAITPLSAAEISAVRSFIDRGGCAVLATDNDTFGGGASSPANQSVLAAVGLHCTGTGNPWSQNATVPNPALSPVTSGPFGSVASWQVGWTGWFDVVPGNGVVLGKIDQTGLPGLVVFPRHALAACSGAVVALSDTTMLVDGYYAAGGGSGKLILNSMAYFSLSPCAGGVCGDINGDGVVDGADLGMLLGGWGTASVSLDLNADGTVDGADLGVLLGN